MSFIGIIQQAIANLGPSFLQQKNVGTFLEAVGLTLDGAVEQLAQGMRLSQPLRCDSSALPVLSYDRGIRTYATEPEASKRYRLSQFWQLRRQFGTHQGEMRNLQPFFLPYAPIIRIVHQAGDGVSATWHTLAADGSYSVHRQEPSNWDWDGNVGEWSRFWVIIYVDAVGLPAQPTWDGGQLWDGGSIWDGLYTRAQILDMVGAIVDAKSAHSHLAGLIFATDPASFDPTRVPVTNPDGSTTLPAGNWYEIIDHFTGQPTRLQSAVFAYLDTDTE